MPKYYSYDENFFSKDAPEVFYWAGFIAADGCIVNRDKGITLQIKLAYKDELHLQKFKKCIKFTGKITRSKHVISGYTKVYNSSDICINISKSQIIEDIKKFNIVPRKSLTYTFPEWIKTHKYINHFIRGYFDGDGSVSAKLPCPSDILCGRKIEKLQLSFRGTENFLNSCQEVLMQYCNIKTKHKVSDNNSNIGQLSYCGNRISLKIAKFLYKDSNKEIFLERKHKIIFNGFFDNLPENFSHKPIIGINEKTKEIIKFNSATEASKHGFNRNCIYRCVHGERPRYKGYIWKLNKET